MFRAGDVRPELKPAKNSDNLRVHEEVLLKTMKMLVTMKRREQRERVLILPQ